MEALQHNGGRVVHGKGVIVHCLPHFRAVPVLLVDHRHSARVVNPGGRWFRQDVATKVLLDDSAGFLAFENRELADGFVRFLGECYVRRGGMTWTNRPEWGPPLYADFGPAVQGDDTRSMVAIAQYLSDSDGPRLIEHNINEAARQTRNSRPTT